jgi:hypothetical protein
MPYLNSGLVTALLGVVKMDVVRLSFVLLSLVTCLVAMWTYLVQCSQDGKS